MAFFCSQLLTFILRRRRSQEVFLCSPRPGLPVSTHPYPYLVFPSLDGRTVYAPVLAQSLFPSFRFLRDLLYTCPFSFTASDFLFYIIPVSMQTPVSKKVCVPCDLPLCLFLFLEIVLRVFSVLFPTAYLLFLVSSPHS